MREPSRREWKPVIKLDDMKTAGAFQRQRNRKECVVAARARQLTLGQLIVVLVVGAPERVLLRGRLVKVLVEPLHGDGSVVVRVLPLPLVKGERLGLSESLARVLGPGGGRCLLLVDLLGGSGLGCGGSLGCGSGGRLGLLLGRGVGDGLLDEIGRGKDGLERLLIDDGVEETGDVDVVLANLGVEDGLGTADEDRRGEDVGQSDAVANKEGLSGELVVEVLQLSESLGLGLLDS